MRLGCDPDGANITKRRGIQAINIPGLVQLLRGELT